MRDLIPFSPSIDHPPAPTPEAPGPMHEVAVLPPVTLPPALLRAKAGAKFLSISAASWHRLDSAGKLPEGKKLGGCKVWSRVELEAWIASGMPDRAAWNTIWAARKVS